MINLTVTEATPKHTVQVTVGGGPARVVHLNIGRVGPQGPAGRANISVLAAAAIGGHKVVTLNSQGEAMYASNTVQAHGGRVVGLTTHAAGAGADVDVQSYGELVEPSWNWNTNLPVYLGVDGLLTQVEPIAPAAKFSITVGFPISSTSLFITISLPIILTV